MKYILKLLIITSPRRWHCPVIMKKFINRGSPQRRMSFPTKYRKRFLKEFFKRKFVIVRPLIIGIDGKVQLTLA
ncbi:Uncharacterised protein [Enterobacter cloacae]|nr:Uncharacterised protein [Enterobacter cloacae]